MYYDTGNGTQALGVWPSGINVGTYGEDYLSCWDDGDCAFPVDHPEKASWYKGNIATCADKGMRLPTLYETTANASCPGDLICSDFPTDASGLPASLTGLGGVPLYLSYTWTASSVSNVVHQYLVYNIIKVYNYFLANNYVSCVAP